MSELSPKRRALVLFSGGQDSTTCLAWALEHFDYVETLGFDYGQRHAIELTQRPTIIKQLRTLNTQWENRLGQDQILPLPILAELSNSAMIHSVEIKYQTNGLPNTFVPGRNLLFLTCAAALGYRRRLDVLVGGMCETDFSGYPDCRDDTLKALQIALNLGMEKRFRIESPLMWLTKKETWELAATLGGTPLIELIRNHTHTCYLGERGTLHDWGYGCGYCPACELRARGHEQFQKQINL